MKTPDFIVVGGGIMGLLTAWELVQSGAHVSLFDKGEPGRESSWAGGGILSPLYPWRYPVAVHHLARWSQRSYPAIAAKVMELSDIDCQWRRDGFLILEEHEQKEARRWGAQWGQPILWQNRSEIATLEPSLQPLAGAGLWLPEIAQIRNPRLLKGLKTLLARAGVAIHPFTAVTGFIENGQKVLGVHTPHADFTANTVVLCAGAWSAQLLTPSKYTPKVKPIRGQMILFQAKPGLVRHIILKHDRYLIPRQDGRILCGSTIEDVGFCKETNPETKAALHKIAIAMIPALADFSIERHWGGLRPGSPNGVPYIGWHPEYANLFIQAGHFRNGVVLGPASARLASDLLLHRAPILDPKPYALDG